MLGPPRIHVTAEVSPGATVGAGTQIWNHSRVREEATIGRECVIGSDVYIDPGVVVGDRVKLENRVSLFRGARLEDGVFVGPHSVLLNDRLPRATTPEGELKTLQDWTVEGVTLRRGCSVGGACTLLPGVTVGRYALVGAGSVVTRDVPEHGLAVGNPARLVGRVCRCGHRLGADGCCQACGRTLAPEEASAR